MHGWKHPALGIALTDDGVRIAYQVTGGGVDLLWPEGWLSHVEILWEYPPYARWMQMLGRSFRVIHFDKRAIGLSDRTASPDSDPDRRHAIGPLPREHQPDSGRPRGRIPS